MPFLEPLRHLSSYPGKGWRHTLMGLYLALPLCGMAGSLPPILLGTTAPFSGPFAEYGEEYRKGADACATAINDAGGVRGRLLKLEYLDDGYEAARSVQNARVLAGKGIAAFVNLVGTGSLQALRPVLEELDVPVFGISSGANQLRDTSPGSRWIFHTKASYGDEFTGFAHVLPTIGITKVALVYQDNPFGRAGLDNAKKAFEPLGQPLPAVLVGSGPEKIAAAVAEVRQLAPQVVVLIAAGAAAPEFIAQYQQAAGMAARVAVLSVVGGRVLTDRLQTGVAGIMTSMVYPNPWSRNRRVVREYQSAMAKAGQAPSMLSLEGCINLRFAVEALRASGDDLSPGNIRRTLERGLVMDLGDFALRLPAGGQVASSYTSLGIYRTTGRILE